MKARKIKILRPDMHGPLTPHVSEAVPAGVWVPVAPEAVVRVAPSFARRVRAYKAAGLLVAAAERHARREACAGCDFREATGHRGLYRCKHRSCGCGGGDELRMAMPATKCPLGAEPEGWPTEHTEHTEESKKATSEELPTKHTK